MRLRAKRGCEDNQLAAHTKNWLQRPFPKLPRVLHEIGHGEHAGRKRAFSCMWRRLFFDFYGGALHRVTAMG